MKESKIKTPMRLMLISWVVYALALIAAIVLQNSFLSQLFLAQEIPGFAIPWSNVAQCVLLGFLFVITGIITSSKKLSARGVSSLILIIVFFVLEGFLGFFAGRIELAVTAKFAGEQALAKLSVVNSLCTIFTYLFRMFSCGSFFFLLGRYSLTKKQDFVES